MLSADRQQLLAILAKIDRPGTFCTTGLLRPILPGLNVSGVGPVGLPLEKRVAAALKKQAHQAPYGKGTETVVDTDVRRVWEIDADHVKLANPRWSEVLQQAVSAAQVELGLENQKLQAHLYKLLIYETGSFFLAHRDGEKLDRMVATLVVVLPSAHQGGELVVRHDGREEIVDFGPKSEFETQFAAFYADCEHEIRPVTSGFRLSLVYNLTLEKSKRTIAAPTSREHIAEAARLLGQWKSLKRTSDASSEDSVPSKLAVLLDHQCTEAGLTYDALKGIDRARADLLFAAARESGWDASLGLVTYWESGSAESVGYDDGYRRRRYDYDEYDEYEDEVGDDGAGDHVMGEVYDSSLSASHFCDDAGNKLAFGQIPLIDEEVVSNQPLTEGEPSQEEFEGYTGNAGMTLERWYHHAAVLLWPAESRFDVLTEAGVESAVGGLKQMIRHWKQTKHSDQETLKKTCLEFASRIIAQWPEKKLASGYPTSFDSTGAFGEYDDEPEYDEEHPEKHEDHSSSDRDAAAGQDGPPGQTAASSPSPCPLLSALQELGDVSLIGVWIRSVLAKDVTVNPGKMLGDLCEQYGWDTLAADLQEVFVSTSNETLERHASLLADFASRKRKNADRERLCVLLAGQVMSAVESWDPKPEKRDWQARVVDLGNFLPLLTKSFLTVKLPELMERLVTYVLARPKVFDLTTVQVPVLLGLQAWLKSNVIRSSAPLRRWLAAVVNELTYRKSNSPREPVDWRRQSATGCDCADCKQLRGFLEDPLVQTLRLPLAEQRRRHIHGIIDGKQLDTTHVTQRTGRPYTLVCTKTKASYERALKAYHVDLDHLVKTQELLDWHDRL